MEILSRHTDSIERWKMVEKNKIIIRLSFTTAHRFNQSVTSAGWAGWLKLESHGVTSYKPRLRLDSNTMGTGIPDKRRVHC